VCSEPAWIYKGTVVQRRVERLVQEAQRSGALGLAVRLLWVYEVAYDHDVAAAAGRRAANRRRDAVAAPRWRTRIACSSPRLAEGATRADTRGELRKIPDRSA